MKLEQEVKLIDGRTVMVRRLNALETAQALKELKSIPKAILGALEGKNEADILEILPTVIGDNATELFAVLAVPTSLNKEEVGQLYLVDLAKIIKGILDVNNFSEIMSFFPKKSVAKKFTNARKV